MTLEMSDRRHGGHPARSARTAGSVPITGVAAGVPYVAHPPSGGARPDAPVVVGWHLMDAPRTEAAFAAALPLDGLDAWRIYLGLPMCGSRTPTGGLDEVMRLGSEDAVRNLYGPVTEQAASELGPALDELRGDLGFAGGRFGLLGGSAGAAVAQLVMAESGLEVGAAVLVSPLIQLRPVVAAVGRRFGVTYPWDDGSSEVAGRLDFVSRSAELMHEEQTAVLLIVGAEDDDEAFRRPAESFRADLARRYTDASRVSLVTIPEMAHGLADEPGIEPAPQTDHAARVDGVAVAWFRRYLPGV